jgi:hypothetical protein
MKEKQKNFIVRSLTIPESVFLELKKDRLQLSKFVRQAFEAYKQGKWKYDNLKD